MIQGRLVYKRGAIVNSQERVFTALDRKVPDRVPILEWVINDRVIGQISPGCSYADFIEQAGLDAVCATAYYEHKFTNEKDKLVVDEWGIVQKQTQEELMFSKSL